MRGRSFALILFFAGIAAGSPAIGQPNPLELSQMMREGCDSLTGQQAAARVAEMEAGLPGLIERRRLTAAHVLVLLAEVRRLDRLRLDVALSGGTDDFETDDWFDAREGMRDEVRQLRSLDLAVRMIESWLPHWRGCRDQLLSAAVPPPPIAPPPTGAPAPAGTPAAAVSGKGATLRFSEYSRMPTSIGGRETFSGDDIYLLLRFGGDGRLSGSFEARVGTNAAVVAGTIRGNWSHSEVSGQWETQPGRIARFRILAPRFEAGPNSQLILRGQGVWCAPAETVSPDVLATGDYARFYGMIWDPANESRPALAPEADLLCPNRGGPN